MRLHKQNANLHNPTKLDANTREIKIPARHKVLGREYCELISPKLFDVFITCQRYPVEAQCVFSQGRAGVITWAKEQLRQAHLIAWTSVKCNARVRKDLPCNDCTTDTRGCMTASDAQKSSAFAVNTKQ